MAKHVPDAGSYAPVTVLVDERADGVHLSYDRMASFLAPYGNRDAVVVARSANVYALRLMLLKGLEPPLAELSHRSPDMRRLSHPS
jgi:hypothetical protein